MYLKMYLREAQNVENKTPLAFLHQLNSKSGLERKPLRFTYSRLNSLMRTLEVRNVRLFAHL
jgi:DNA excision repair protein ERCC-2